MDYSNLSKYSFKDNIGEGNFGKVKLATFEPTGEELAVKILNKKIIEQKMKNTIFRELDIIIKFNHINVVYVYEIIEDPENYYIIMEYCKNGELFDYIVNKQRLTEHEAAVLFYQLINGVYYIHRRQIAHRDLKPENLLLDKNNVLKIIDFGLSHEFDYDSDYLKTKCGSPSYAAPEIILGQLYDGFQTDSWCCGIILYGMLCGFLPFEGDSNKVLFENILKCNPELPDFLSDTTKELIVLILNPNPDERITIEQIREHEFYYEGKYLCETPFFKQLRYSIKSRQILCKRIKTKEKIKENQENNNNNIDKNDNNKNDKKDNSSICVQTIDDKNNNMEIIKEEERNKEDRNTLDVAKTRKSMNVFKKKLFDLNNLNSINNESLNSRIQRILGSNNNNIKNLKIDTISVSRKEESNYNNVNNTNTTNSNGNNFNNTIQTGKIKLNKNIINLKSLNDKLNTLKSMKNKQIRLINIDIPKMAQENKKQNEKNISRTKENTNTNANINTNANVVFSSGNVVSAKVAKKSKKHPFSLENTRSPVYKFNNKRITHGELENKKRLTAKSDYRSSSAKNLHPKTCSNINSTHKSSKSKNISKRIDKIKASDSARKISNFINSRGFREKVAILQNLKLLSLLTAPTKVLEKTKASKSNKAFCCKFNKGNHNVYNNHRPSLKLGNFNILTNNNINNNNYNTLYNTNNNIYSNNNKNSYKVDYFIREKDLISENSNKNSTINNSNINYNNITININSLNFKTNKQLNKNVHQSKHIQYLTYKRKNKKGTMSHKLFNTCLISSPKSPINSNAHKMIYSNEDNTLSPNVREKVVIVKMRNKIKNAYDGSNTDSNGKNVITTNNNIDNKTRNNIKKGKSNKNNNLRHSNNFTTNTNIYVNNNMRNNNKSLNVKTINNIKKRGINRGNFGSPVPAQIRKILGLESISGDNTLNNFSDSKISPTHKIYNKYNSSNISNTTNMNNNNERKREKSCRNRISGHNISQMNEYKNSAINIHNKKNSIQSQKSSKTKQKKNKNLMICTTFGNNTKCINKKDNSIYSPRVLGSNMHKLSMRNNKIFPLLTGK